MKIVTTINKEAKMRTHTLSGEFDFDEIYRSIVGIYEDPEFEPDLNSVWDLTEVMGIQIIKPNH